MPEPTIRCEERVTLSALPGVPMVQPGDDLGELLCAALERAGIQPATGRDIVVVTSKVVSRAENRFVDLAGVTPSEAAVDLAARSQKDPRFVELVLRESTAISRVAPNVIVTRHRLGFVSANAGIDQSNTRPASADGGPWALLLPLDPDASARALQAAVRTRFGAEIGIVISDSFGRPFREGTVGAAIGVAGLPPLFDQRGGTDLNGRTLEATITAVADQVAAAADLVAGQAAEGRAMVHVRGIAFSPSDDARASSLLRPPKQDLYA